MAYDIKALYEEMEYYLIQSMLNNLSRHKDLEVKEGFEWEQWQAKKLREIRKYQRKNKIIVSKYGRRISLKVRKNLLKQYYEGAKSVDKAIEEAMLKGFIPNGLAKEDFFTTQSKKITALINSIDKDFKKANIAILRQMDDVYRRTVFDSVMFATNGVLTQEQAIDKAAKDFLAKGIDCITYKNGANVNIAYYSDMAIRTASRRAHLVGEGERRQEWGISTVLISQYLRCSPTCRQWQGRVYVDDVYSDGKRKDGNYPLLSEAIAGGLFHPNCRHTSTTYFPGISSKPRPVKVKEATEEEQELNRLKRKAKQYKRMKEGSLYKANIEKYARKEKEVKRKIVEYQKKS